MAFSEQHLNRDTKALADGVLEVQRQRLAQTVKGTGASTTRTLPQLPIEVWENVIDHLWNDQWSLRRCRLVCRAWYSPSRFHLDRWVDINNSVQGVKAYARMLKQMPELSKRAHEMSILGIMYAGEHRLVDLSALSMAAILLAPKLPRLDLLKIRNTEWKPWTMHRHIFLHLSAFSVTRLDLHGVTFPSITVFGRLVCALRGLVELECCDLEFIQDYFDHDMFDLYQNRVNIRSLTLGDALMGSEKFIEFLAHPCISNRLQRLNIDDSPLAAELQHQWKYKQLLDAVSGSLPELQLVLPYSEQQTHTEVLAAGSVPSFIDHTSLQRLQLTFVGYSRGFEIDTLCQVLLSIKSGQLREIVIVLRHGVRVGRDRDSQMKEEMKKLLDIHKCARCREVDNHLASASFKTLSNVEFAHAFYVEMVTEGQWKQKVEPLFPRLMKRGIFRATVREVPIVIIAVVVFPVDASRIRGIVSALATMKIPTLVSPPLPRAARS